jgi:hypothetical protein
MKRRPGWARGLLLSLLWVAALLALAGPAGAQDGPSKASAADSSQGADEAPAAERAEDWFKAGAAAYVAGDYLAAIQALEAAYALKPLPLLAFNLAQAQRRQYFVDRRPEHLLRSVALFHRYLEDEPSGGRRGDAVKALAQLEPLLAQTQTAAAPPSSPDRGTRILVLCDVPNARIAVDGAEPGASPLIREVTPGKHQVEVRAAGYRDGKRQIDAEKGELVPVTVTLAELPSRLQLSTPDDAEVYVDGVLVSQGASALQLELPSGVHRVSVAEKGHRVATQSLELQRGQDITASFQLEPSRQRLASNVLFVGSAVALAAGGAFSYMAVSSEAAAKDFLSTHDRKPASTGELVRYNDDVTRRNRFRWLAGGAFGASLGLLVTGLFLHELDTPGADELYRSRPQQTPLAATTDRARSHFDLGAFVVPGEFGASLRGEF